MMGGCNGRAEIVDIEDAKKAALEAALKTVQVAKNRQADLLLKFKGMYDYFEPESYDSHDHWFLEIPQESELRPLIDHLRRYSVAVEQILSEESTPDDGYRESYAYAKYEISQLIEYLQQLHLLLTDGVLEVDEVTYPSLPDDLDAGSSRSARQTRDYLVIRDYGQLLDLIQRVLDDFQ